MHFCTDGAHAPYAPAEKIRGTALKDQTKMSSHTDMVLETDLLLGKLMEVLEKRGLLEDTLICFTSDNGGIPAEQHLGHDAVGGLRGLKSYMAEGGHRVPFLVRWPGKVPAGAVRNQVVCTHDIVATALELAGVSVPSGQCLDAVSLLPVLTGKRDDSQPVRGNLLVSPRPAATPSTTAIPLPAARGRSQTGPRASSSLNLHARRTGDEQSRHGACALRGAWKLVFDIVDQPAAIYDLESDPAEQTNLFRLACSRLCVLCA